MRLAGFQGDHLFGAAPKYQDDKIEKKSLQAQGVWAIFFLVLIWLVLRLIWL